MKKRGIKWLLLLSVCALFLTLGCQGNQLCAQKTEPVSSPAKKAETVTTASEKGTVKKETKKKETAKTTANKTQKSSASSKKKQQLQGLRKNSDGSYSYYEKGKKLKNSWKTTGGAKYYFGKDGKAYTGKKKVGKAYYYFSKTGKMETGWKTIKKKKYYFAGKTGKMLTGRHSLSHYLCTFNQKGQLIRKVDKNKKMVALTYDDGPSKYTPQLLDTLEQYDAVATFFVVGSRASTYEKTLKREAALGCEIGNHTYDHKNITKISSKELKNQLSKTNAAIKKATGKTPKIMRPPGGAINNSAKKNLGMPAVIWSVDTLDWKTRSASRTTKAVLGHVQDGDIILMHDLHKAACEAAETIVPELIDEGYQLVTVSELAECRGGMKNNQPYHNFRKKKKK